MREPDMRGSEQVELVAPRDRPPWPRALVFRFGVAYWIVFVAVYVASCMDDISKSVSGAVQALWNPLARWMARDAFGISYELSTDVGGSGDKAIDWVSLFCFVVIAAV